MASYQKLAALLLCTLLRSTNGFCPSRTTTCQTQGCLNNRSPLTDVEKHVQQLVRVPVSKKSINELHSPFNNKIATRSSSMLLHAMPFDLGLEDIIYKAQSTASTLASASINSSSMSSTSVTSLAVLYFAGLLTSFSPCSLGLLPLTVSYISNAAGEREDKAVFFPTIFFALGLASVFCGLGLSVAFIGGVFGSSSSSFGSILLALFGSGVSITMGLQLLELVNIPLPSIEIGSFSSSSATAAAIQGGENVNCSNGVCSNINYDESGQVVALLKDDDGTRTNSSFSNDDQGNSNDSNSLFRTFLLGGSSALVASPCATPVLTSILGFVAASRDPILGAILLLTYTVGYSTPLLVIGASGGQALANAQVAASSNEDSWLAKVGTLVNPLTAGVLIWYGTNGLLQALFGDPSMIGVLDY